MNGSFSKLIICSLKDTTKEMKMQAVDRKKIVTTNINITVINQYVHWQHTFTHIVKLFGSDWVVVTVLLCNIHGDTVLFRN